MTKNYSCTRLERSIAEISTVSTNTKWSTTNMSICWFLRLMVCDLCGSRMVWKSVEIESRRSWKAAVAQEAWKRQVWGEVPDPKEVASWQRELESMVPGELRFSISTVRTEM
jgi:hypothetical protein